MRSARVIYVQSCGTASGFLPKQSVNQSVNRFNRTFSTTATATEAAQSTAQPTKQSFFKSDKWTKTVGTVGAIANWSIPIAAISNMMSSKDPAISIDPMMTGSLAIYSILFMRWAIAITPPNYPLMACHVANVAAQSTQLVRYAMCDKSAQKAIEQSQSK